MVRVECRLKRRHGLNHGAALSVVQEGGLLDSNAVLRGDATVYLAAVVHHEGLNDVLGSLLQTTVFVARQDDVQMQVAIADMSVAVWQNELFLLRGELLRVLDQRARLVHDLVVMASRETDVVLKRVTILHS